jgi:hypothetical protein
MAYLAVIQSSSSLLSQCVADMFATATVLLLLCTSLLLLQAPFVPHVKGNGDTSNFETYPESTEDRSQPLTAEVYCASQLSLLQSCHYAIQ